MSKGIWLRIYGLQPLEACIDAGNLPPLRISLEAATSRLAKLPRMFLEADGSFLWNTDLWQLEGTLYDDGLVVRYVELRGDCPLHDWEAFFTALGESFQTVTLELLDLGRIVPGTWLLNRYRIV